MAWNYNGPPTCETELRFERKYGFALRPSAIESGPCPASYRVVKVASPLLIV